MVQVHKYMEEENGKELNMKVIGKTGDFTVKVHSLVLMDTGL